MKTNEYIESGILELYVFGKLTPAEEQEVVARAAQDPAIQQELSRIEIAFEQYALAYGIPPPPGTLAGILRETGFGSGGAATDGVTTPGAAPVPPSNSGSWWSYLFAGLLIASAVGAYFYNNELNEREGELTERTEQLATLQNDCDEVRAENARLESTLSVFRNTDYSNIKMNATGKYEENAYIASVFYNPNDRTAYLDPLSLPQPPTGKQYQLWAIVNGAPVDMGVFDTQINTDTLLQQVPYIAEAQAFAVTIEDEGGVESPTLEEMIVVGNVS